MKIFIIYPCQGNMVNFNYGIASVAAVLEKAGHNVKLIIADDYIRARDIINSILNFGPDTIGISCSSNHWEYTKSLCKRLKAVDAIKATPIFVGGPHAIVFPMSIKESEAIEGLCIGEGEYAFLEVIDKISKGENFHNTPNFYFRDINGGVIKNEMRPLIEDLDSLPFPSRVVFPDRVFKNYANFTFSRGCPFSCSYCCNSAFHKIFAGKGRMIRHRSVAKAIEEIKLFLSKHKSDMLSFDDDCFNKNPKWFKEFCMEYKEKIGLPYTCNTRPELLDRESARLLKESGCEKINIGVESGDEHLRKTVLNRNITDEDIIRAFEYAREFDLETMSFNMIGIPGETVETIKKTIGLNKRIKPTYTQVSVFYPYAGTPLGELCKKKGFIEKDNHLFTYLGEGSSILNIPGFSKRDIKELFFRFDLEIYNKGNFIRAYIAKRIKYAFFAMYNLLPYFLKSIIRSITMYGKKYIQKGYIKQALCVFDLCFIYGIGKYKTLS